MSRFYEIDGEKYPSVTTILSVINKPGLMKNFYGKYGNERAEEIRKASAERGSTVHDLIRRILLQQGVEASELAPVGGYIKAYESFGLRWPVFGPERKVELTVYSKEHGFAGTLDLLAGEGKRFYITDWKTSADVYMESLIQLSAYWWAVMEQKLVPEGAEVIPIVVQLKEDGTYNPVPVRYPEALFRAGFLPALDIFNLQREWRKKYKMKMEEVFDDIQGGTKDCSTAAEPTR